MATPCEENRSCWLIEVTLHNEQAQTYRIDIFYGEDGNRTHVCQSFPWFSADEARIKARHLASEVDAAMFTTRALPAETMQYFKLHPPITIPEPVSA